MSNPKSMPLVVMPLRELQEMVGNSITVLKNGKVGGNILHMWLSIGEYLKDAERWDVIKNQDVVFYPGILPDDIQRVVDRCIEERKR